MSATAAAAIRAALEGAPRGRKTAEARRLAELHGVSVSTVYAAARLGGPRRVRAPRADYEAWVTIAVRLAHLAPDPVPLDLAIRAGVQAGDLPPEALDMPIQTARRVRRRLGLVRRRRRARKLAAQWPMQQLLIDGSSSERLSVVEQVQDDWLLRLVPHRRSAQGYKNKPLFADRLRLLVYGLWDRCSGLALSRYAVARGENAAGAAEFLCWALAGGHPPGMPMRGVPTELWSDQGALVKAAHTRDLLDRLDVEPVLGPPESHERMGGVERPWRTQWERFERALYLRRGREILFSELNARLMTYCVEMARRAARTPHPDGRRWSRADCWTAMLARRPERLRELPPDPMRTLAREVRRRVDRQGIVRVDGAQYEVPDWHDKWVTVRLALADGGKVVVEDDEGGRRECARWTPRPAGEIAPAPATPLDRLLADPVADDWPGADVYGEPRPTNVVPLPPRTAPPAPLADPLDADALPSLDAAWRAFAAIYPWPLSPANRAAVERRLAGLSLADAEALARDLAALAAREARG